MNKTILIFQPDIPPYRWGVFEQVIARIRGDVLFFRMRNKENKELPESIKGRLLTNAKKNPTTPAGFFLEILRLYFKIRPDVVILSPTPHFLTQMTILLLQKIRFRQAVIWHKGPSPERKKRKLRAFLVDCVMRVLGRLFDAFVLYGQQAKKYFLNLGVDEDKLFIAQNTIDTDRILGHKKHIELQAIRLRQERSLGNKKIVLILCTLKPLKRICDGIEAFKLLQSHYGEDIHLWIVGDGPERDKVVSALTELNSANSEFFGQVPLFEDNYYIAAADLFLVPGGGGLSIVQSMLLNTPVVCADEEGADTELVVHNETGLRFARGDINDMFEKCVVSIENSELCLEMCERAYQAVGEKATVGRMADGLIAALEHCGVHEARSDAFD